ncbi:hypothetical protein N1495_03275 [Streptococcus didelphis]|uniref:hypothetical protein n=1 Tax=Streptococcus didelphis TaxID=102886 RepID=UPI00291D2016|nr:hypothetical protein N1495_03275 [Streptococcus didelphis]
MGKQKNHKKRLKLKMKHQGLLKNSLNKVEEGLKQLNQQAKKVKEEVIERGQEVFEDLKPKKALIV